MHFMESIGAGSGEQSGVLFILMWNVQKQLLKVIELALFLDRYTDKKDEYSYWI